MDLFYRYPFLMICIFALSLMQCGESEEPSHQQELNTLDLLETAYTERLILRAKEIVLMPPVSIKKDKSKKYGIESRTYVSLACYWWPDPASDNGLPYIRIDGAVNPETRGDASDLPALVEMAKRVELLSTAYLITGDSLFAERAIQQIHSWFIDPNSAMLPHLEHAQMVRGRDRGRSYGIIDTWWFVRVIHSIPVLEQSDFWTEEIETGLKNWFSHYLNWLRNSEFGKQEVRSKNNHGTWFDVQLVTFANFVGQYAFAKQHIVSISQKRLSRQITRTGRQRYETRRPKPEHYSIYNLNGWFELIAQAEKSGIHLHHSKTFWSGSIEDALLYLIRLMHNIDFEEIIDPLDRTDSDRLYLDLLIKSAEYFSHEEINQEIKRITPLVRHPEIVHLRNSSLLHETPVSDL